MNTIASKITTHFDRILSEIDHVFADLPDCDKEEYRKIARELKQTNILMHKMDAFETCHDLSDKIFFDCLLIADPTLPAKFNICFFHGYKPDSVYIVPTRFDEKFPVDLDKRYDMWFRLNGQKQYEFPGSSSLHPQVALFLCKTVEHFRVLKKNAEMFLK